VAEKEKPELILLDIVMPGLDGFAVCCKIRERSTVPVVMLSAREGENDKAQCAACGANDYLPKPFVLRELLTQIKLLVKQNYGNSNPTK
jgi:DNA-binding response OmpR family regulator